MPKTNNVVARRTLSRRNFIKLAVAAGLLAGCQPAQPPAWPERMANAVMRRQPYLAEKWGYEAGVVLLALKQVWQKTGQTPYLDYIKANIDKFVGPNGDIQTYRLDQYNLDQINTGKLLFLLYRHTGADRYQKAAELLKKQLQTQPRTAEGGFWHKQIYPRQMWLDGIYMASPFCAEFAQTFNDPTGFDEAVRQITLIERHTRDARTGLLYHGWDESKRERWANPRTGCSACFWGRAVGWYLMALVDVLDFLPPNHAGYSPLVAILDQTAAAVAAVQDEATGLWYQVLDQGRRAGNYLEASASSMMVYALAKGSNRGYINPRYGNVARRGYAGILNRFIKVEADGLVSLTHICAGAGLGGEPYRDGSFEYYVGEQVVTNDYKGVGPFIMAGVETETSG